MLILFNDDGNELLATLQSVLRSEDGKQWQANELLSIIKMCCLFDAVFRFQLLWIHLMIYAERFFIKSQHF
jgi:hypothetical protein